MSKRSTAHERQKLTEMSPWQQKKKKKFNYNHPIESIYFLYYLARLKNINYKLLKISIKIHTYILR